MTYSESRKYIFEYLEERIDMIRLILVDTDISKQKMTLLFELLSTGALEVSDISDYYILLTYFIYY